MLVRGTGRGEGWEHVSGSISLWVVSINTELFTCRL